MRRPMMMLVNTRAGRGIFRTTLGDILEAFYRDGWSPVVCFTEGPGSAARLAQQAAGLERLVCMGGDGTLSDVMSGLMRLPPDKRPELGYIPAGTANDIANTLGLPRVPRECARKIIQSRARTMDMGLMGEESYFSYVAAFGAFTEVSYQTDQEIKQAIGHMAYVLEALRRLPMLTSYNVVVEYDGGMVQEEVIFGSVSNTTSLAGMFHLDEKVVSLNDGLFEVMLIRRPRTATDLNGIIDGILNKNYNGPSVTLLQSRRVRFLFEKEVPWTRDGENGGVHRELLLQNQPEAIRILA